MNSTENIDYWEKTLQNPPQVYIELFQKEKEYLRKNIKEDCRVLDIGCGEGRNILSIADITDNIIGVDINQKAVEDSKVNLKDYPNIKVIEGDVLCLPFDDKSFDAVIFSMTLVNLDNEKQKALSEIKRVAKDGAKMIVSVYSEKALEERLKMYRQVGLPIKDEINGKFIFDIEGLVSEQFSMVDIEKMIRSVGLSIEDCEEVKNLAYIFTFKKI